MCLSDHLSALSVIYLFSFLLHNLLDLGLVPVHVEGGGEDCGSRDQKDDQPYQAKQGVFQGFHHEIKPLDNARCFASVT